jgi:hypothetical protein
VVASPISAAPADQVVCRSASAAAETIPFNIAAARLGSRQLATNLKVVVYLRILDVVTSAAKRLRLALDMYELGEKLQQQRLKRTRPNADDAEIAEEVRAWRCRRPGAQNGDCPGPPARRFG